MDEVIEPHAGQHQYHLNYTVIRAGNESGFYGVSVARRPRTNNDRYYFTVDNKKILFDTGLEAHMAYLRHIGLEENIRIMRKIDPNITLTPRESVFGPKRRQIIPCRAPDNKNDNTRCCPYCNEWKDITSEFTGPSGNQCNQCSIINIHKLNNTWRYKFNTLWNSIHDSSMRRNFPKPCWESKEDFMEWSVKQFEEQNGTCHYETCVELTIDNISPERLNEDVGYSPDNTVFIQKRFQSRGGVNQWSRKKVESIPSLRSGLHPCYNEQDAEKSIVLGQQIESRGGVTLAPVYSSTGPDGPWTKHKNIREASEYTGIPYPTVTHRLTNKIGGDKYNRIVYSRNSETDEWIEHENIRVAAAKYGLSFSVVCQRIKNGTCGAAHKSGKTKVYSRKSETDEWVEHENMKAASNATGINYSTMSHILTRRNGIGTNIFLKRESKTCIFFKYADKNSMFFKYADGGIGGLTATSDPLYVCVRRLFYSSKKNHDRRNIKRAKRKLPQYEHTITIIDILKLWITQKGRCAVLGIPMIPGSNVPWKISLDRIDNDKTYTIENCRLVVIEINTRWLED